VWVALLVTVIGAVGSLSAYLAISSGISQNSAVIVYLSQALLQISVGVLVVGGIGLFASLSARALVKTAQSSARPESLPIAAVEGDDEKSCACGHEHHDGDEAHACHHEHHEGQEQACHHEGHATPAAQAAPETPQAATAQEPAAEGAEAPQEQVSPKA
jgi:ABC-type nickel/cobalt efflux system permease component RcnA